MSDQTEVLKEATETTKWVPPRMSQDELKKFVLDYCDGKIFTDRQVHNVDMLHLVFMILIFADTKDWDLKQIGIMYEYLSEAGPRSINGMPIFMSARFMHTEDAKIVGSAIDRELKRREELSVLPLDPEVPESTEQSELFKPKGE